MREAYPESMLAVWEDPCDILWKLVQLWLLFLVMCYQTYAPLMGISSQAQVPSAHTPAVSARVLWRKRY